MPASVKPISRRTLALPVETRASAAQAAPRHKAVLRVAAHPRETVVALEQARAEAVILGATAVILG
jgi:hypothetical protein